MSEESWLEHLKFISEQQSARITINQDGCKNLLEIINKYKSSIDKIKEYAKANKIIEIIALLEVEEIK